jgi:hypothetical protein
MSTTHNHRKLIATTLGATVAGVVAPALLVLGAGSAQAQTRLGTVTDALGVTVSVQSDGPNPSHGTCFYTAIPVATPPGQLPPMPVYGVPFTLQANRKHNLWFPGIQSGSTWEVTVDCQNGTNSPVKILTY